MLTSANSKPAMNRINMGNATNDTCVPTLMAHPVMTINATPRRTSMLYDPKKYMASFLTHYYKGRSIQILESRGAAADHPVTASCLEGEYLTCVIARVA
jgi:hypothetical protein